MPFIGSWFEVIDVSLGSIAFIISVWCLIVSRKDIKVDIDDYNADNKGKHYYDKKGNKKIRKG